jgi:hypothetical protein
MVHRAVCQALNINAGTLSARLSVHLFLSHRTAVESNRDGHPFSIGVTRNYGTRALDTRDLYCYQ